MGFEHCEIRFAKSFIIRYNVYNEFKVSDFELIKKFTEFDNKWTPKLNSFFEVWKVAENDIKNYLYFKAAFDQFIKFETDGVRFLKAFWYFGDVKIIAVV